MPSTRRPAVAGLAGLVVALTACSGVSPTPRFSDAERRGMKAEDEAVTAEVVAERQARKAPQVELPPSSVEIVDVPAGVTRLPPTPGVAVAHRCRQPGADAPPSVALLQSGGDEESDLAFLHTRLTRPAAEAPAAEPRCAIVAKITLPSRDPDPNAQVIAPPTSTACASPVRGRSTPPTPSGPRSPAPASAASSSPSSSASTAAAASPTSSCSSPAATSPTTSTSSTASPPGSTSPTSSRARPTPSAAS